MCLGTIAISGCYRPWLPCSSPKRAAQRGICLPRTLPEVDYSGVRYQVYILNRDMVEFRLFVPIDMPRGWLGHPVPAIIKTCAGVAMPSQRVRNKLIYLINLWSWLDPLVRVARTGLAGPSVGPPDCSAGGSGGRQDPAKKRKGEGSGRSVGASERKLGSHQAVVPDNSSCGSWFCGGMCLSGMCI